ncbi:hypothetical protein [Rhodocaloribacter sp.]
MRALSLFLPALMVLCAAAASAQAPPATDVWLAPMAEGVPTPEAAVNLTDRDGYDNQPSFTPDGQNLLYTSFRDGQTDIFRIEIATRAIHPVTRTPESEYSPVVMPGGEGISVVRVEADGTQRLWAFAMDGSAPRLVLEDVRPVGYYAWGDDHTLVLFVLGDPPTLQIADTRTGLAETRVHAVGRSIRRIPGTREVSFIRKRSEDYWGVRALNVDTRAVRPIGPTLPGREDHAWTPDGKLLMADGAVLYRWDALTRSWQPLADFSSLGVTNITRLAVHPEGRYLAFVADRPEAK